MRREDPDLTLAEIAGQLGPDVTAEDVAAALMTLRTPNPRASRATLNGSLAAGEFVAAEGRPGEPKWAVLDRLLDELVHLRRVMPGLTTRRSEPRGRDAGTE
jgi:hypothetical protein